MKESKPKVVVILGPTAGGKTKVGVKLAAKFNGEIISADSRQVYQGMDVGTGKDIEEYKFKVQNPKFKSSSRSPRYVSPQNYAQRCGQAKFKVQKIKYHLIDVASPRTEFNVAKYQKLAYRAIEDVLSRGKVPIIVGGTGLYVDAVVNGYEFGKFKIQNSKFKKIRRRLEKLSLKQLLVRLKKIDLDSYKVVDKKNRRRVQRALEIYYETGTPKSEGLAKQKPPYQFLKIGIKYPKEVIDERIDRRLIERLEKENMVGEARRLHRQGLTWKRMAEFGLEYRWLSWYLQKKVNYNEMVESLSKEIKKFAKRQMTWFKRDEEVVWLANYDKIRKGVEKFLNKK